MAIRRALIAAALLHLSVIMTGAQAQVTTVPAVTPTTSSATPTTASSKTPTTAAGTPTTASGTPTTSSTPTTATAGGTTTTTKAPAVTTIPTAADTGGSVTFPSVPTENLPSVSQDVQCQTAADMGISMSGCDGYTSSPSASFSGSGSGGSTIMGMSSTMFWVMIGGCVLGISLIAALVVMAFKRKSQNEDLDDKLMDYFPRQGAFNSGPPTQPQGGHSIRGSHTPGDLKDQINYLRNKTHYVDDTASEPSIALRTSNLPPSANRQPYQPVTGSQAVAYYVEADRNVAQQNNVTMSPAGMPGMNVYYNDQNRGTSPQYAARKTSTGGGVFHF